MPKIIRIDLKNQEIKESEVEKGSPYEFFAGRALTSKLVYEEVPFDADPLGKDNKLIIASGFLGGTTAPNSGRLSIGSKSPLTGGIKESNVGGRAPAILGKQDIRAIILENQSKDWVIIKIKNTKAEIINDETYKDLNNYKLAEVLMEKYGNKIGAFTIGLAGNKLFKHASIASIDMEGYPSRHAGRGGMGAIMGSKKVKAIVVIPSKENKIRISDKETFKAITKNWFKEKYNASRTFSKYGTAVMVSTMNELYGLPTQNFRRGKYEDAKKISGNALNDYLETNNGKYGVACSPGCCVQCSNIVMSPKGEHITSGLEYETIALNGSNLLINDIEKLAWIDHYTDDVGMDSIETGNCMAVMMEAGKIKWGDADAVINLIKGISEDNSDSLMIGLGCYELGKKLNVERVAHVKKQGFPAYEPRSFKAMGVTFATSPMGADHTAGPAIANRKAYANKSYGETESPEHKVELSKELQIFIMVLDSMGLCYFMGPSYEITARLAKLLNAKFGETWNKDPDFWVDWARKVLLMEHEYNIKSGIKDSENVLPKFFLEETLPEIDRNWDINQDEIDNFWKNF